jgi:hypothetical protein
MPSGRVNCTKMGSLPKKSDLLNSLAMYFSSKRTALRSALQLRSPLSVAQAEDLRVHYSNYFTSLVSGLDLVRDSKEVDWKGLTQVLEARFVTPHAQNGKQNYAYLRELRNSIVHRGMNIFSAASFPNSFPLLFSPQTVTNPDGTKQYQRFGVLLIQIIALCETVIGPLLEEHMRKAGLFDIQVDEEVWRAETVTALEKADNVPVWVTKILPEALLKVDVVGLHESTIGKLLDVLKPYPLTLQEASLLNSSVGSHSQIAPDWAEVAGSAPG